MTLSKDCRWITLNGKLFITICHDCNVDFAKSGTVGILSARYCGECKTIICRDCFNEHWCAGTHRIRVTLL